MEKHEVHLAIGDTLHVGEHTFTIMDIEGEEIHFRVELRMQEPEEAATQEMSELAAFQVRPR